MSAKILILLSLILESYAGWEQTVPLWNRLIELASQNNYNVSMVAWQHIYDSQGRIKEVATAELAFPALKSIIDDNSDTFTRGDQHSVYNKLVKEFENSLDVFVTHNDRVLLYRNPHSTYTNPDGLVTFNKTEVATRSQVESFIKEIEQENKNRALKLLVLKYDSGKLLEDVKINHPSIVSYVPDSWQIPETVLMQGPKILTEIYVKNQNLDEIPKELALKFDEEFGDYEWSVLVNPGRFKIDADVWIKLSIDGFEFFDEKRDVYLVYGVKK